MPKHEKLDYLELPSSDFEKTKTFFSQVFGWQFTDYGEAYMAFDNQGLEGGFYLTDKVMHSNNGSALPVFYSDDLEATQKKILAHGGSLSKEVFSFPGGRRFQFLDPCGNEFGVWAVV